MNYNPLLPEVWENPCRYGLRQRAEQSPKSSTTEAKKRNVLVCSRLIRSAL
jgi:hypothetical protein